MQASGQPDAVLASEAQNGNRSAFDQLVVRHKERLFRIVRQYVGNSDDALDVLQETFVAAWAGLDRYDRARDFGAWLRTIALNKCRDFSRRQAVRRNVLRLFSLSNMRDIAMRSAELSEEAEQLETRRLQALDAAIAALPASYKEPLVLTAFGGLTHEEAAEQLGTTAKAIEMKLRRARQRLAEAIKAGVAAEPESAEISASFARDKGS